MREVKSTERNESHIFTVNLDCEQKQITFHLLWLQVPNSAIRECSAEACMEGKGFHTGHGTEMSLLKVTQKTQHKKNW